MRRLLPPLVASLAACTAINGIGDFERVDCLGSECADAASTPTEEQTGGSSGGPNRDAGGDAPVRDVDAASTLPLYCRGITFYAGLDGTATSGLVPPLAKAGSVAIGAFLGEPTGRLGSGFRANANGSTLLWPTPFEGTDLLVPGEGTVAFYFRANFSNFPEPNRIWFDAFAGTTEVGPRIALDGRDLVLASTTGATTSIDLSQIPGLLGSSRPWVLAVATWKASATPSLVLTTIAATKTSTGQYPALFTAGRAPTSFRLGFDTSGANASFDELVIWNRRLEDPEMQALFGLTTTVDAACRP